MSYGSRSPNFLHVTDRGGQTLHIRKSNVLKINPAPDNAGSIIVAKPYAGFLIAHVVETPAELSAVLSAAPVIR